jgi:hypothetical protein
MELASRLRAAQPLRPRKPDRVHSIDLTRRDVEYIWSISDVAWNKHVPPLPIANGERVALAVTISTRMPHPMHLHGHRFKWPRSAAVCGSPAPCGCRRGSASWSSSRATIGLVGLSLPLAVPHRSGHVSDVPLYLTRAAAFVAGDDQLFRLDLGVSAGGAGRRDDGGAAGPLVRRRHDTPIAGRRRVDYTTRAVELLAQRARRAA